MRSARSALPWMFALVLAACGDPEAARRAAEAQAAARTEALAGEAYRQWQAVQQSGKEELSYAFAQDLVSRYPQSQAARTLQPQLPALKQRADAVAEQRRLESLWTYHAVDDQEYKGMVYTAYIHASSSGAGASVPGVRLVLRRHPSWGQSVYLLIDRDDFACKNECRLAVSVDGAAPQSLLISRAEGANPPALFLEEDAKALDLIDKAQRVSMAIPLSTGSTVDYLFEVGALDISQLGPPIKP